MTQASTLKGDNVTTATIPTGFDDLDTLTDGGLHPGELIVIAGFPGIGSSTLALDLMRAAAIQGGLVANLAALESTAPRIEQRILAAEASMQPRDLDTPDRARPGDAERLAAARQRVADGRLIVTDQQRDLSSIADAAREALDLRMLIIDGAHLLIPAHDYGGRAQFADDFARDLKELAVELGLVVVVTVPLEFPFGERPGNVPLLRDFGKRQSFAAAADLVILVHRDDHYERESPRAGEADLIVAKSRNAPRAVITVAFQGHYARFRDLAQP